MNAGGGGAGGLVAPDAAAGDRPSPRDTGSRPEAGGDTLGAAGAGGTVVVGTGGSAGVGAGGSRDGGADREIDVGTGAGAGAGDGGVDRAIDVGGGGVGGAGGDVAGARDAALETAGPGGADTHEPPDAGVAPADAAHGNCPAPLVFCDGFDDGVANGWQSFEQNVGAPGVWGVGSAVGHLGTTSFVFAQSAGPAVVGYHYQFPSPLPNGGPWQDQTVTAWIRASADLGGDANKAGICSRFTSDGTDLHTSGYCLFMRDDGLAGPPATGRIQFSKKLPGGGLGIVPGTTTASANVPVFVPGNWYKVALRASGTTVVTLRAFIDDVPVGLVVDDTAPTLASGGPALVTRSAAAAFDDVSVSVP